MFDDFFNTDLTSFFGRDMSEFFNRNQNMVIPAVNIKESPDNFQIEVAAPSLRKEDFKLHLEKNILTVSAQRETRSSYEPEAPSQATDQGQENTPTVTDSQATEPANTSTPDANQNTNVASANGDQSTAMQGAAPSQPQRYTRQEFSYTSFQRSFTLPEATEPEQISATYQDGILTITVPKKQQASVNAKRTINIS